MNGNGLQKIVVVFLGFLTIVGFAIGGLLAFQEKAIPDFIIAATSGALGGLTGVLVREPENS